MEMYGVDSSGGMFRVSIERASGLASKLLGEILPPEPMFLGKIGHKAGLFVTENNKKIAAFILDEIDIRTRFIISGESIEDRFITAGWGIGVMSKQKWKVPDGFSILLQVSMTSRGGISQSLGVIDSRESYTAPIHNVFSDGVICTGADSEFSEHTNSGFDITKVADAPRFLSETIWNSDAGYLTDSQYEWMFKWDLNGNQIVPECRSFMDALLGKEVGVINPLVRKEMWRMSND